MSIPPEQPTLEQVAVVKETPSIGDRDTLRGMFLPLSVLVAQEGKTFDSTQAIEILREEYPQIKIPKDMPDLENVDVLNRLVEDYLLGVDTPFNALLHSIHVLAHSNPEVNSKLVRIASGL